MSRTSKIIATALSTAALSVGTVGLAAAGPLHVEATSKTVWCC